MTFRIGERCIVLGDEASWGHHFPKGTQVIATELDGPSDAWLCSPVGKYSDTVSGKQSDDTWWVRTEDLRLAEPEITEREIMQLFGIEPRQHCSTCTCQETP